MNEVHQSHAAELERQDLIRQCHCLIAVIANRPTSVKLLRKVVPMLQIYAGYKASRARLKQRGSR
ncbi:MAG: hypothetical protein KME05_16450 [Gloeocapsa sp. UFS-A4-WI-NPMV-4B04]|jgi:hypothetical protein|nr:hypothetical protein [Gloeocapsa sp. UFS-A4-WI-NPMV-4B04]